MPSETVLVTNTTTGVGLAAAKSLARAGYRVITVDFPQLPLGLRSRYSASDHAIPGWIQSEFEAGCLELLRRERPSVFLAVGTRYVYFAAKYADRLPEGAATIVPSLEGFMAAYVKSVCIAECRALGIACPSEYSYQEALRLLDRPGDATVVVKPDCDIGAASGVRFVRDAESLREAVADCENQYGRTLIEDYIPGGPEAMKTVVLLFSRESRLAAAFTTQKVRQLPYTGGLTVASRSTDELCLVRQVLPFFEKWRWRGAAEVELKFDARDGRHKVVEINPRYPGYLRFPIHCGLDLPVIAVRLAQGARDGRTYPAYRTGASYLNPGLLLKSVAPDLRRAGLSELGRAFTDLRGLRPAVYSILDDPLPLLGRGLRRLGRTGGSRRLFQVPREQLPQ
jgi:predicted ATP-grasp superfamily ATP-dependent carboligase